jgi:hypothetical protein
MLPFLSHGLEISISFRLFVLRHTSLIHLVVLHLKLHLHRHYSRLPLYKG